MSASKGHADFVERLFYEHRNALRRYLTGLTTDTTGAEDLVQEVYVRVVRAAARYEPRERERAWLFRIARNVFLDDRRRRSREAGRSSVTGEPAVPPVQHLRLDLSRALGRLATDDREAFLLAEVGGLSYEEIAHMLGSTVGSVRSRIYRARLALRDMLLRQPGSGLVPAVSDSGAEDE
jgi:RNA polymerase sigma-70 factor (ECF subfamily)